MVKSYLIKIFIYTSYRSVIITEKERKSPGPLQEAQRGREWLQVAPCAGLALP